MKENMKVNKLIKSFALCAGILLCIGEAMAAGIIATQREVEPGVWTSDYDGAMAYAEANNIPAFVFWANKGCTHCEGVEREMNKELFSSWMSERKILMVFVESNSTVKKWIKEYAPETIKAFPFAAVYWPKNTNGEMVLEGFSAYKGNMSRYGASSKDSNVQQIMDTVDFLIPDWNPSGVVPAPDPVYYTVSFVVDEARGTATGSLSQQVESGKGAVAPTVSAKDGWEFTGWDKSFSKVTSDITVTAKFEAVVPRPVIDPAVFFKKAKTISAIAYNNDELFGRAVITLGKYNAKKKNLKATFKVSSFGGKTYTKTLNVVPDEYGDILGLDVAFKKPVGTMTFDLVNNDGEYEVIGEGDEYFVEAGDVVVGGKLESEEIMFSAEFEDLEPENENYEFIVDAPMGASATVGKNGATLNFGSAPKLKYNKYREDGETWYELAEYDEERYPNANAVKITYKPNTGVFTGSFKIYASNEFAVDGKKPTLKTYTAKVSGYVVNGVGVGTASVKVGKRTYVGTCTFE